MKLINGEEVREKQTVNHGVESKKLPVCPLVSVDMLYTQFRLNKSWGDVLRSEDNVILTNWVSCNTDKTLRETSGSPN
jgi:hypothetical protein